MRLARLKTFAVPAVALLLSSCGGKSSSSSTSSTPTQFVFVASQTSSAISAFSVTATTGALTALANTMVNSAGATVNVYPMQSQYRPIAIVADPKHDYVYIAASGAQNVTAYSFDKTGLLTQIAIHAVPGPGTPAAMTVSPDGNTIYVLLSDLGQVLSYSVGSAGDITLANTLQLGGAVRPARMAMSADGTRIFTADPAGAISVVNVSGTSLSEFTGSPFTTTDKPADIACCNGGSLYIVDTNAKALVQYGFSFSGSAASLARAAAVSTPDLPSAVFLASSNKDVLVAYEVQNQIASWSLNGNGAPVTQVNAIAAGTDPVSFFTDTTNTYYYVPNFLSGNISIYSIDANGNLTTVGAGSATQGPVSGTAAKLF